MTTEEYISAGQHAHTKGKKTPNYKRVTQIRQITKTLRQEQREGGKIPIPATKVEGKQKKRGQTGPSVKSTPR